jgi:homoserine kinase
LPAEALDYGVANGFTITELAPGERVRWSPGVRVAG